jgi:hypothetical protein
MLPVFLPSPEARSVLSRNKVARVPAPLPTLSARPTFPDFRAVFCGGARTLSRSLPRAPYFLGRKRCLRFRSSFTAAAFLLFGCARPIPHPPCYLTDFPRISGAPPGESMAAQSFIPRGWLDGSSTGKADLCCFTQSTSVVGSFGKVGSGTPASTPFRWEGTPRAPLRSA